jgi:hypothetical protein
VLEDGKVAGRIFFLAAAGHRTAPGWGERALARRRWQRSLRLATQIISSGFGPIGARLRIKEAIGFEEAESPWRGGRRGNAYAVPTHLTVSAQYSASPAISLVTGSIDALPKTKHMACGALSRLCIHGGLGQAQK